MMKHDMIKQLNKTHISMANMTISNGHTCVSMEDIKKTS